MTAKSRPKVAFSALLLDVSRIAAAVNCHAQRLSAASDGRISPKTANELHRIREELVQLSMARSLVAVPSAQGALREALEVIANIRAAARYAAAPDVAAQLASIGTRRRSAIGPVMQALHAHLTLLREHERLKSLVPADTDERGEKALAAFRLHGTTVRQERREAEELTARRDAAVREVTALLRDVRSLAAVLFRQEPEVQRQFAPSPAKRRSRPTMRGTAIDPTSAP